MKTVNILSDCSKKDAEMVQIKLKLHGVDSKLTGGNKKGHNIMALSAQTTLNNVFPNLRITEKH